MNSRQTVLLDTSIQIERLIGSATQQAEIEEHLAVAGFRFVSSHYVYMEFQRAVLADYIRIYNAIHQTKTWNDTAQALRSQALAYRPRSLGRCLQILTQTMVLSHLERDNALELLKVQIHHDLPMRFWRHVHPLADLIACDLIVAGVTLLAHEQYTVADRCRKETAACHLPDFLADHRSELRTIADYLAAHPNVLKGQARVDRLLQTVIDEPRAVLGQSACWPLGDVIITLQALPDAAIWSIDADFAHLTQALGLMLYQPVNNISV